MRLRPSKILALLMTVVMLLGALPATALAVLGPVPPPLPTPTGLRWDKTSGSAVWDSVPDANGCYVFGFQGPATGWMEENWDVVPDPMAPPNAPVVRNVSDRFTLGNGRYAFRVKARGSEQWSDSEWSDWCEFNYAEPEEKLTLTNLRWDIQVREDGTHYIAKWQGDPRSSAGKIILRGRTGTFNDEEAVTAYGTAATWSSNSNVSEWDYTDGIGWLSEWAYGHLADDYGVDDPSLLFFFEVEEYSSDFSIAHHVARSPLIAVDDSGKTKLLLGDLIALRDDIISGRTTWENVLIALKSFESRGLAQALLNERVCQIYQDLDVRYIAAVPDRTVHIETNVLGSNYFDAFGTRFSMPTATDIKLTTNRSALSIAPPPGLMNALMVDFDLTYDYPVVAMSLPVSDDETSHSSRSAVAGPEVKAPIVVTLRPGSLFDPNLDLYVYKVVPGGIDDIEPYKLEKVPACRIVDKWEWDGATHQEVQYRFVITSPGTYLMGNMVTLKIRAYIDGCSALMVENGQIYWRHYYFAEPGCGDGHNYPTYVNGYPWMPWEDPYFDPNNWYNTSSKLPLTSLGIPRENWEIVDMEIIKARGSVDMVHPEWWEEDLNYIELNDGYLGGAAWYEVTLTLTQSEKKLIAPTNLWWIGIEAGWEAVPRAEGYEIEVEHPDGIDWHNNWMSHDGNCYVNLSDYFIHGSGKYAFHVRAWNYNNHGRQTSLWSDWCEFYYDEPPAKIDLDNLRWDIRWIGGEPHYIARWEGDSRSYESKIGLVGRTGAFDDPEAFDVVESWYWYWYASELDFTDDIRWVSQWLSGFDNLLCYFVVEEYSPDPFMIAHHVERSPLLRITSIQPNIYTVTFDIDGTPTFMTVTESATVPRPEDPAKLGYTFDGWYLDAAKFDFNTPITDNITLTAKWKSSDATLKSLTVSSGTLTPAFDPGVNVYDVRVQNSVTLLVAQAVANDAKASVSAVRTFAPSEGFNVFSIPVTAEDGTRNTYTLNVIRELQPITNLQASQVYSRSAYLTWNGHPNPAVVKYFVMRDGVILDETGDCFYVDRLLEVGETYNYQVYGVTYDNIESARATVDVTTSAPVISSVMTAHAQNKISPNKNTIYVDAVNSKNYQPLGQDETICRMYFRAPGTHIREYVGEADLVVINAATLTYIYNWDVTFIPDGDYIVGFRLIDVDGAYDEKELAVKVDNTPPAKIVDVRANGTLNGINVSWAIAAEGDTNQYKVYRRAGTDGSFVVVATINDRNTLGYLDASVVADVTYYYYVVGLDDMEQESVPSNIASAKKGSDAEAPTVTKMTPASNSYIGGTTSIAVTATDNVGVTKVELQYSTDGATWTPYGEKTSAPYAFAFDTTSFADGAIRVRAIASDAMGNASAPLAYAYSIDNTGPEKVTGLAYTSTSVTVTLSWNDVADKDISFFRVERKAADNTYATVMDVTKTLGANIKNLQPLTSATYRVVGYDHLGNRGIPSDDIVAATQGDTTPPVISSIMPKPGHFANNVSVKIEADDDYAVRSIAIQVSINRTTWATVNTAEFAGIQKTVVATYVIDLSSYQEGAIYVRGVATDTYGNVGDAGETAPFVQHFVDRTAPAAPTGVQAFDRNGIVEVTWAEGPESDIATYAVYRSDQANGTYTKLADKLSSLNCLDRAVAEGVTYYYKAAVTDLAGNESTLSASASVLVSNDRETPRIVNCFPAAGTVIGPSARTFGAYVTDNRMLDQIKIEYKNKTAPSYAELATFNAVNDYQRTVSAAIPLDGFAHGDTVSVSITATDKGGNASAATVVEYLVDKQAPQVASPAARYDNGSVALTWQSDKAADLIGYKIYRSSGGAYSLIGQQPAVADKLGYEFADYSIALTLQQYTYRIDAVDSVGNAAGYYTNAVSVPNRMMPVAVINCDAVMQVGVDYEIDASESKAAAGIASYAIDFGDGASATLYPIPDTKSAIYHRYGELGTYTIRLTVTDNDGNQTTAEKSIRVKERSAVGRARIRVVDEDGKPVKNANVYFDLGEPGMVVGVTDIYGYAPEFSADVGWHAVGCIIPNNEWLPSRKDILVTADATAELTMTMIHETMIEGNFEIHRMTFEEIVAAGIDISKPENQYIVNIVVTLKYVKIEFQYNPYTQQTFGDRTIVYQGTSYTAYPINWPANGPIGGGEGVVWEPAIAVVEIPVTVSALKDFFDVKLHIINNASSEFAMLDNVITLDLPDGLTIMDTVVSESDRVVRIPEIRGQTTETIRWILRGDKVGDYWLSADYVGRLALFEEAIATRFVANDPVEVRGLQGVTLTVDFADEIFLGRVFYNVTLANESSRDINMPNLFSGTPVVTLFRAADGTVTEISAMPSTLRPGESIKCAYFVFAAVPPHQVGDRWVLFDYYYTASETYGLQIILNPQPLSYFIMTQRPQAPLSTTPVTGKRVGDAPFQLATTGGSGTGSMSYSLISGTAASVTPDGLVTILGEGTVKIKVTKAGDDDYLDAEEEITITIEKSLEQPVTSIRIASAAGTPLPAMYTLSRNSTMQLAVAINGGGNSPGTKITWTVSDTSFATVDANGRLLTKNKTGTVVLTAKCGNISTSVLLRIS